MAENKTLPTDADVETYLDTVKNPKRRDDTRRILALMRDITGEDPVLWGPSLIGFGSYSYANKSGKTGSFFRTGCAPRAQALSIYVMPGFDNYSDLLDSLGKYKTGQSCLYINKLEDVDMDVLEALIKRSYKDMKTKYPRD